MQVVAKKMEKMLETSLQQLKVEQNLRKEAEDKSKSFESKLSEWAVKFDETEAEYRKELSEKDEKIINLEASIEFLQQALIQKEEELSRKEAIIKKLRDTFNKRTHEGSAPGMDKVCDFEIRLATLLKDGDDVGMPKDGTKIKTENEPEATIATLNGFEKLLDGLIDKDDGKKGKISPKKRVPGPPKSHKTPAKKKTKPDISFDEGFHGFDASDVACEVTVEEGTPSKASQDGDSDDEDVEEDEILSDSSPTKSVKEEDTKVDADKFSIKHKVHCRICKEEFQNKYILRIHEKKTGHYLKYECSQCHKRFKQKVQMTRHEAQIHSDEMPYQCQLCPRRFKSEYSCRRHQENREIHEKLANWSEFLACEFCGKQFERRRKWCLEQHLLTHQAENKYPCDICGKYLRTQGYLNQHMKACSGIKDEECAFCGKRFSKKTVLVNHERLHTGETPYHCRLCNQHFRTHMNYREHGIKIHNAKNAAHFNQLQNQAEVREKAKKKMNQTM